MRHLMTSDGAGCVRRVVGAIALVVLAGCGAASAHGTEPLPGTIRSGTSLSDGRIARDARLRLTDLPPGWKTIPKPSLFAGLSCPGLSGAKSATSARMTSPEFQLGQAEAVSAAYVYATSAAAKHWFGQLSSAKTRACIGNSVRRILGAAERPRGVDVAVTTRRAIVVPVGDERVADRISIRLSALGASERAYLDLVFVRAGRGIAAFSLADVGTVFQLETQVVQTVVGRLTADLGGAG
jgi:hypothetical protein